MNLSTSCAPQTVKIYKKPDDVNNMPNYDLTTRSDVFSIIIKSTDGIEMKSKSVIATEEPTTTSQATIIAEPTTIAQATIIEEPTTIQQSTTIQQPTTTVITLDNPTRLEDSSTKQAPPRVNFVRTTISSTDNEAESLLSCSYDEDTGLITNTSGDCYGACDDGKFLIVFFNENNILFCCCK